MEDRNLTEKESLELIARMIKETQNNVARYAAYPSLIWGYMTTFIAVVVWFAIFKYEFYEIQYLWWSLPIIAFPLTIYFSRKSGKRGAQTYMGRITNMVWGIFGCVGFLLSAFSFTQLYRKIDSPLTPVDTNKQTNYTCNLSFCLIFTLL